MDSWGGKIFSVVLHYLLCLPLPLPVREALMSVTRLPPTVQNKLAFTLHLYPFNMFTLKGGL